jgi:phage terminase large subunit-like protein
MINHFNHYLAASPQERAAWIKSLTAPRAAAIHTDWSWWQREDQAPPAGDWRLWIVMAGRGFGKTRMGAEWVRAEAERNPSAHIALIGATMGEVRSVMVEGQSGLLAVSPDDNRPKFEPSLRQLTWSNGAKATLYSASEPESLRGPAHSQAWADEVGKWGYDRSTWDNLMMTMRVGPNPQIVATTTPRPTPLMKRLIAEQGIVITRGTTKANQLFLPAAWLSALDNIYGGTRLGRQELDGEWLEEVEGALWSPELLDQCRVAEAPSMRRIVIGVDPPAGSKGDACGIIAVGKGEDDKAYVLADHSVSGRSPEGWARAVAEAADHWQADRVIAEVNNGGDMVRSTLMAASISLPFKAVHATRSKTARAEPVQTLYQAGRAFHAGRFSELEDELCGLIAGGDYAGPGRSPDRADALVWAMTELMLGAQLKVPQVRCL